jgi:DNA-binding beta-propeller fold protein YncE
LTGEENFRSERKAGRSLGDLLAWLVGYGRSQQPPNVLQRPQTGAVDADGRVYVTDVSRRAVYVFDERSPELKVWEWATEQRRFAAPVGIVVADQAEVLVADAELGAVFRLDRGGKPLGQFGEGLLERPTGIARDPQTGTVYVADTAAHVVKVFSATGVYQRAIGRGGDGHGELNAPTHIAFANDRLYVTDTFNCRVQVFDTNGVLLRIFGDRGVYVGNFSRPKGIAVDDEGNIYVVESYYDNLLVFDSEGRFLMPLGGTGKGPGQFYLPAGIWTDGRSRMYVADMFNGRVAVFQFLGGGQ